MARNRQVVALVLILTFAAALRLTGLDWDGYQHYHPDERYITWVATTIEAPADLSSAFSPHASTFNPFYWPINAVSEGIIVLQDQPRSFAYGHLPLYLGVLATRFTERLAPPLRDLLPAQWPVTRDLLNGGQYSEFRHLTAVTRALTALFDLGTVGLIYLLGKLLYNSVVGLLSAALLAVNVMHVQLAHFFTVDPYLTFFTVAAVYISARILSASSSRNFFKFVALAATAIGLAVGSKFSAILLVLPLSLAIWLRGQSSVVSKRYTLIVALVVVGIVFAITNPFALLDWSCDMVTPAVQVGPLGIPALNWGSCYMDNVLRQSAMVRGDNAFDFTRQYVGTVPYGYPLLMQLRWGMGYLLGVAALGGFGWAILRGVRRIRRPISSALSRESQFVGGPELVVLSWTVAYFLVTGSFFAKFMRYMQPLTPFLMIYAAAMLVHIPQIRRRYAAVSVVVLATALYALAFVNMYRDAHPWNAASRWMYNQAPTGALIATELWDDPLPSSMEIDGEFHNRHIYDYNELNWLSGILAQDDIQKLRLNLNHLAQADYVTLSSNRGYGVVSRLETLYPLSHQYYKRLFAGDLGFEIVLVTGRGPQLGSFAIWPDHFAGVRFDIPPPIRGFLDSRADLILGKTDESFTVYDQPLTIVLQNKERLNVEEMLQQFELP